MANDHPLTRTAIYAGVLIPIHDVIKRADTTTTLDDKTYQVFIPPFSMHVCPPKKNLHQSQYV